MTKLELYQELVTIISPTTIVKYGKRFCYEINTDTIYIMKDFEYDFDRSFMALIRIDEGFRWYNHCSSYTFAVLHELGHALIGEPSFSYGLQVKSMMDAYDRGELSRIEVLRMYCQLEDERMADEFAYEFAKKNKNVLKRLEREIKYGY